MPLLPSTKSKFTLGLLSSYIALYFNCAKFYLSIDIGNIDR